MRRLEHKIHTDSIRHNNQSIKKGVYSEELGRIITLD
jgi:hypothetical protein